MKRFKDENEDIGDVAILLSQYIQALGENGEEQENSVERNKKNEEEVDVSDIKQILTEWANTLLIISTK